jgi:hypothetical protein
MQEKKHERQKRNERFISSPSSLFIQTQTNLRKTYVRQLMMTIIVR